VAGTHAGRTRRPSPWPWLVPVAALLAGALFASSVRAAEGHDLRSDYTRLPDLIREQNRVNEQRQGTVDELQSRVDAVTAALAPGDSETQSLDQQANEVSLQDAKLVGGEVPEGQDPDNYVIHQQDVQAVVNALWAGGAEAMMIQDQRVVSTSAVRCVGNTLILQGRVYSPPYVITAIGDPNRLVATLDADPQVNILQEWSVAVGLGYEVQVLDTTQLPAYAGSITPEHAEVAAS
jgi:uncharacterized protein YlxW (UPF0749 family)